MQCKFRDIKLIYDWCEKYGKDYSEDMYNLKGKSIDNITQIAYYTPSQANWSYIVGILMIDGCIYKVVTVFGQIKAIMPLQVYNYEYEEIK